MQALRKFLNETQTLRLRGNFSKNHGPHGMEQ
jgi:hypothetical protein